MAATAIHLDMKKEIDEKIEMLDEYDFSDGVRGKYVNRLKNQTDAIVLEPDVEAVFTDS